MASVIGTHYTALLARLRADHGTVDLTNSVVLGDEPANQPPVAGARLSLSLPVIVQEQVAIGPTGDWECTATADWVLHVPRAQMVTGLEALEGAHEVTAAVNAAYVASELTEVVDLRCDIAAMEGGLVEVPNWGIAFGEINWVYRTSGGL